MKANRKSIEANEEAVSPVIAVILMVAITVVLAATVFVLVGTLGKDVGDTGPTLGMHTDRDATSSSSWRVAITSITSSTALDQFNCILTDSDGVVSSGDCSTAAWVNHTDIGKDGRLSVGDRLTITGTFSDNERYTFEIVHRPTGTNSGSVSHAF